MQFGYFFIDMRIYFDDISSFSEAGVRVLSIFGARGLRVAVLVFLSTFVFILMTFRHGLEMLKMRTLRCGNAEFACSEKGW